MLSRLWPWATRNDPTEREWLQLNLESLHLEARRQDARNRAANRASVAHKWPRMASWLVERREAADLAYNASLAHSHALAVFQGITEPWED